MQAKSTEFSISVCMATYNGAVYVDQQLRSILDQLGQADEVILVDDYSGDSTLQVVAAIGDSRIKIFRNERNMGVARTFERAIGLATGELIFLSDQDDVWHPEKVAKIRAVFEGQNEITLVISDARIVDKQGKVLVDSFFLQRGRFSPSLIHNIIKNKFLGCVMSFRQELRGRALPFPSNIPQHDIWIGLVNALYGKAYYIDLPLVDYRRHEANASSASTNKHASFSQMAIWRWRLIKSLLSLIWRSQ